MHNLEVTSKYYCWYYYNCYRPTLPLSVPLISILMLVLFLVFVLVMIVTIAMLC
jgi:hypothetical protein